MPVIQITSPLQVLFMDRLMKGEKGNTGPAPDPTYVIADHLDQHDHGKLHEHGNKGFLDLLSYDASLGLLYDGHIIAAHAVYFNGVPLVSMVDIPTGVEFDVDDTWITKPAIDPKPHIEGDIIDWTLSVVAHGAVSAVISGTAGEVICTVSDIFGYNVFVVASWEPVLEPAPEPGAGG